MPELPTLVAGRYELRALLGQGGMGAVHRAWDRELGREVALKIVDRADWSPWAVEALRQEFRLLSGLRHPHLVDVFDFGALPPARAGGPASVYFTEEFLDGRELGAFAAGRPSAEWLPAVVQVCRALEFLHSRGYVHGDVKPSNILVLHDGSARLVDLGLASEIRVRGAGDVRGTMAYLAPECFRGAVIDGRADLYALGVLLYQLAADRLPFVAGTPREWMKRHCTEPPLPLPGDRAIPPFLERIILRLLEKDPRARFFRANEVIEAINRGLGITLPAETAATLEGRIYSVDWVGRREVLDRLIGALRAVTTPPAEATSGAPAVLVLRGEPGMGKSRCLRELSWRAQLDGTPAVRIACRGLGHAAEQPLRALGRALARSLPAAPAARPTWAADAGEFLDRLLHDAPAGEPADAERARPFLAQLAAEATAAAPAVLLLDDADQAGEPALRDLAALLDAASRLERPSRLLVCATVGGAGSDALENGAAAARALAGLLQRPGVQEIALPPLTALEAELFAAGVLGLERVPESFAQWLHRSTGGVPFWIEESLRTLVARGRVQVGEPFDRWEAPSEIARAEGAGGGAAERAAALLEDQARRMSADERTLSEALAVIGRAASREALTFVLGAAGATVRDALATLSRRGVLRAEADDEAGGGERWWFARGALGRYLYARLADASRLALHRQVAAAAAAVPPALPLNRGEVALHLALADAREPDAAWWVAAAQEARGTGNAVAAERILRHALRCAPAGRAAATLALANLLTAQARYDDTDALGREVLVEADRQTGPEADRLRAAGLETCASVKARRGDVGGARPMFGEAYAHYDRLVAGGDADAREALVRVAPFYAAACHESGHAEEGDRVIVRHLAQALPMEVRAQFHHLRAIVCRKAADAAGAERESRAGLACAAQVSSPLSRVSTEAAMRYSLAHSLRDRGEHAQALQEFTTALDAFHRLGHTHSEMTLHRETAAVLLHLGKLRRAAEHARRSLRLAEPLGNPIAVGSALLQRGRVRREAGEVVEAEEDLVAAIAHLEKAAARMQLIDARLALAQLLIDVARHLDALHVLTPAAVLAEELGMTRLAPALHVLESLAWRGLGAAARADDCLAKADPQAASVRQERARLHFETALAAGRVEAAGQALNELRAALSATAGGWDRMLLEESSVRLALESGDLPEAQRRFDAWREGCGEWELGMRPQLLEWEARLQRRGRRAAAALSNWQEAARLWERRRAPLHVANALCEAADVALELGDRALARAYLVRAEELWRAQEERLAVEDRAGYQSLPGRVGVRQRLDRVGRGPAAQPASSDGAAADGKTVVLTLDEAGAPSEPTVVDAEKEVLRAAIALLRERDLDELRRRLLEKAMACFGAVRGVLFLDARCFPGESAGEDHADADARLRPAEVRPAGGEDARRAMIEAASERLRAPGAGRRLAAGELVFQADARGGTIGVLAPLPDATGRPLGVIDLDWRGVVELGGGANVELLPLFTSQAAAALEGRLADLPLAVDAALGLPTAAAARLRLREEFDRARKGGWPLTLVLCALTGQEAVRARHGLAAADARLRDVAAELLGRARLVARTAWIGADDTDRLLLALPGIDAAAGAAWVRETTRAVRAPGDTPVEFGLATTPEEADHVAMLLFRARRKLAEGKAGRPPAAE